MRLLLVEDEPYAAEYIEEQCHKILKHRITSVHRAATIQAAREVLESAAIDLCLLDLNLQGESGYELLAEFASYPFETIIISAHTERACQAFEYGVLDFVPKPFTSERLSQAFHQLELPRRQNSCFLKYLVSRINSRTKIIPIQNIIYFKASGNYVEACQKGSHSDLIDKRMELLEKQLSSEFIRIHRSYIVRLSELTSYRCTETGAYEATLKDGTILPLGRTRLKDLNLRLKN